MNYLLALLACGREDYTRRTLAAYAELLSPAPSAFYCYDDGGQLDLDAVWPEAWAEVPRTLESRPTRVGRCAGHANLWKHAAASEFDYVWTVEDDILLLRPLDLTLVAALLESEPTLKQVALIRAPWGSEIPFGSFVEQRKALGHDWYERRKTTRPGFETQASQDIEWIESTWDWTSSPALLSTTLPREVVWPAEAGCESALGPAIMARYPDAVSGYLGAGELWCSHIGLERAAGAFGY